MTNCIPNLNRLEITTVKGIITHGKYTLPNKPWFCTKVLEVPPKQSLK